MEEYVSLKNRSTHLAANPDGEAVFYVVNGVPYIKTTTALVALSTAATSDGEIVAGATITQVYDTVVAELGEYTPDEEDAAYDGTDASELLIELNALRVAYENLRLFAENIAGVLNEVIDSFQTQGFLVEGEIEE